jgi:hypothetical protein
MPTSITALLASLDKGWATLVAAALAAAVSLVSLLVSVLSSRAQARLASRLTDSTNISKEARDYKLKQLTSFYDPVYTLLAANKAIFERIGPTSLARKEGQFNDEETAEVWRKLSEEVIVPNNQRVCEIIQAQLHYLTAGDDESIYLEFLTHAQAYKVFKQGAYEAYRLFPFPKAVYDVVKESRAGLRASLTNVYSQPR